MYCFTRQTLVGVNRVRIQLLRVKPIDLRVKQIVLRVKSIVSRKKSFVLRVKTSVLRVKQWINDPFGHKLQTTLINVTTFYA